MKSSPYRETPPAPQVLLPSGKFASRSPEYRPWINMRVRCFNPKDRKYPLYGGRGITVCERWRESFLAFLADMGPRPSKRHSIERINNEGNYEPGNCRWATTSEQSSNTRRNWRIMFNGELRRFPELTTFLGLPDQAMKHRLLNLLETRRAELQIEYDGGPILMGPEWAIKRVTQPRIPRGSHCRNGRFVSPVDIAAEEARA